jgi:type I restriction enzyme, S subunit
MMEDWQTKSLKDIAKIMYGYTAKAQPEPATAKYLRITDIQNNRVEWDSVPYCDLDKKEYEKYCLSYGDIVFARTGATTGKSYLLKNPPDAVFASYLIRVQSDQNLLTPEFLYQYFQTQTYWDLIDSGISGSAQGGFNASKLGMLKIPIPPIPEQKRIVAKLVQAFTAIEQAKTNVERNIQNAKDLFQSELNIIFSQKGDGWVEKKLIEVNRFIDYRGRTPKKTSEGIRLITAKNVKMGRLNREPEEFINPNDYDDWMTRGIPRKNDVLFTTEAPLANVALLDTDEKIALAQRIITFMPNLDILTGEYLHYSLQSKVIQDKILEKGTGATVTGIKSRLLKEITIFIPSLDIQKRLVNSLNKMKTQTQALESNYQRELTNLDELKKSILQKAFNGELSD